jgi:hypothetical protein
MFEGKEFDSRVCRGNSSCSFRLRLIQLHCSHTIALPTNGIDLPQFISRYLRLR